MFYSLMYSFELKYRNNYLSSPINSGLMNFQLILRLFDSYSSFDVYQLQNAPQNHVKVNQSEFGP